LARRDEALAIDVSSGGACPGPDLALPVGHRDGASDDAERRQAVALDHSCESDYLPTNGQSLARR